MARPNTALIERDVDLMKNAGELKGEILALIAEHGDDWKTHFDFLHPTKTKEEIVALNRAAREIQAERAAGRASAGDADRGEERPTGMLTALVALADCFPGDDLAFLRQWTMQNACFGADRFMAMKREQADGLKDDLDKLERELKRERREDPLGLEDRGDLEDQLATIEMELDQARHLLHAATRAYRKVVGRAWRPTPQRGSTGRSVYSRRDSRRDDRDDRDDRRDDDRRDSRWDERDERRRDTYRR